MALDAGGTMTDYVIVDGSGRVSLGKRFGRGAGPAAALEEGGEQERAGTTTPAFITRPRMTIGEKRAGAEDRVAEKVQKP